MALAAEHLTAFTRTLTWLCSILYQRGVYPPEDFEPQKQYGLTMMVSTESGIKKYLCSVLEQMSGMPLSRANAAMDLKHT